jgi:hypothetical protein
MKPTGLESDIFKFHLKKLSKLNYVEKNELGRYRLTDSGKEYASNIDELKRNVRKQPRQSIMMIVPKTNSDGRLLYLVQKRQRNPYMGYWGFLSGPAEWGEDIEETATREFNKQTGLRATFKVKFFYREKDFILGTDLLLDDKLFAVVEASNTSGEISNTWQSGYNEWMTLEELKHKEHYFESTNGIVEFMDTGESYFTKTIYYSLNQF